MKPNTDRPEACAIGDKVHAFVGGLHQVMSVQAAESLYSKLGEAIEKAKAAIACGCADENHYANRESKETP